MVSLSKIFIIFLFFSTFLAFLVDYGFLAYGPFLILSFFVVFFKIFNNGYLSKKEFFTFLGVSPFVLLSLYSYTLYPYLGKFFNTHLIVLIIIYPLIISIGVINKLNDSERVKFTYGLIKYFLIVQFIICLGQSLNYIVGFGFYIPEQFKSLKMIPGSFANSNDFASILVLILYLIISFEDYLDRREFIFISILIFFLIVLCASRIALVISVLLFLFRGGVDFYKLVKSFFTILLSSLFILFFASTIFGDTFVRAFERLDALKDIAIHGFSVDNSASIRTNSYNFFLENLRNLGYGSFEINNYSIFSNSTNAMYIDELMFQNPHSLIVEVGYWLGYLGLIFLTVFLYSLIYNYGRNKFILCILFLLLSSIPSSVLGNYIFFSFFILICVLKYPSLKVEKL